MLAAASNAEADLDRAEREIEQLRVDHEVALEKSERQVFEFFMFFWFLMLLFSVDFTAEDTACQV